MTEAAMAANRRNAQKAGRPKGAMNAEKLALRDRIQCGRRRWSCTNSTLPSMQTSAGSGSSRLIRPGRPPQPHDGDGAGGTITIRVFTQVPVPDDDRDRSRPRSCAEVSVPPVHKRKERWACLICHRRCGKTFATLMDLLLHALRKPGGRYAYIAPLYDQAKTVAWDVLKGFARPVLASAPNEAELRVDLLSGSRISLFGGDNGDRLRGLGLDGCVLDEYADIPFAPALTHCARAPAILLAHPKGFEPSLMAWITFD